MKVMAARCWDNPYSRRRRGEQFPFPWLLAPTLGPPLEACDIAHLFAGDCNGAMEHMRYDGCPAFWYAAISLTRLT
jgi:hypothetical protein